VGGKQLEKISTNGFDVGGYSLLRRLVMYDSDFNICGSSYEESKKLIRKSIRKKVCPKCGFTTITNLNKCLKCGDKLSNDKD